VSEVLIVGGGLAGGAAATLLARGGRPVQLLERTTQPADKVCGEFLSIEAQRILARLGVDLDHLGASRITTLRLAWGPRTIEAALPFVARGLTRMRLDQAVLERAEAAGARVLRGVTVRSIGRGRVDSSIGEVPAELLLLASGKHEVRGAARMTEGCATGYVGFKTHWRLDRRAQEALAGKVDVILFDGGYAGLQLVEDGMANLCLLVTKARLAAVGGDWPHLLRTLLREPHAAAMLGGGELCAPRPLTIAGVPYGFLHRAPDDGVFRLGDQAAVIPSFCGEGMAIALHSATVAAAVIARGGASADYRAVLADDLARRLRVAMAVQRAGQADWSRALIWNGLRIWPRLIDHVIHMTRVPGTTPIGLAA
jgi:flavin-dependent dehydrogenase